LYLARKEYAGNTSIMANLSQVSSLLASLDVTGAASLLNSVAPLGDFDSDGDVDSNDFTTLRTKYGTSTILYGSGADMNFDGNVDAGDYIMWVKFYGTGEGGGGLAASGVPEPATGLLGAVAAVLMCSCNPTRARRLAASGRHLTCKC
jgi:hypothetical protein